MILRLIFLYLTFIAVFEPLQSHAQKMDCPDFKKAKSVREGKKPKPIGGDEAKIIRGTNVLKFNVIKLHDMKLDIPAFKQFKNNMTDFTADGEEEFKRLVERIRTYLGENTSGEGVTLEVIGSASQIPTSFDPAKPNNNINPDGSSIQGKTSIENNKLLALARATELAKKIQKVFPEIQLKIPTIGDIKLGSTPWTEETQKKLNIAVSKKDHHAIEAVYAPFQKEQYVMVRSREYKTEFIQPEALHTYFINVSPPILWMDESGSHTISHFTVSETTYNKVGGILPFDDVKERDEFIKNNLRINVYHKTYFKQEHWFMLTGKEALSFRQKDEYKLVKSLYKDKILDMKDRNVLENIIVTETLNHIQ